jgi:DNA topoisomerase VI subunit B
MRLFLAIRVFFVVLFKGAVARQVADVLNKASVAPESEKAESEKAVSGVPQEAGKPKPSPKASGRSEALTLLAAMQREARFVDFIQESLEGYSDAQIGAAARDVHRDCAALLNRIFAMRPAVSQEEGDSIDIPAGFDAGRWRLTGNVVGVPPFRGRLMHPGWEATACELPTWTGAADSAKIIAPAEVELA